MALKTNVVDRVSTYPGRVKLTPVSGQSNVYDLSRADSPIQDGTPINAALFAGKADVLTKNSTVYVSAASGSDTYGDGSETAPFATIQKAINSIPKNLEGKTCTVMVPAGNYSERVTIDGFHGGKLNLSGNATINGGITVTYSNHVYITFPNLRFNSAFSQSILMADAGSVVTLGGNNFAVDGGSGYVNAVEAAQGSTIFVDGDLDISNCARNAVFAHDGSRIVISGALTGNNNTSGGVRSTTGSVVSYGSRTLAASTASVTQSGGRIYSGAQNTIPSY